MDNVVVTLIIPVYNCDGYLPKCLDSVCNQTVKDLEIILVDDGSTDRSSEICRQYAERDSRVVYVRQENRGVSAARNVGLDRAKGTYVAFADADDWMDADHLEKLIAALQREQTDCAVCGYQIEFTQKTETRVTSGKKNLNGQEAIAAMLAPELFQGFLWNKLFCLDVIRREQLRLDEDLTHYEDLLFCTKYFDVCRGVCVSEAATYHYRQRENSAIDRREWERKWIAAHGSVLTALERVSGLCQHRDAARLCRARIYMEKAEALRRAWNTNEDGQRLIGEVRAGWTTVWKAPLKYKHKLKYLSTVFFPAQSAKFWVRREDENVQKAGVYDNKA